MRHKGSISQVNIERKKILLQLYRNAIKIAPYPFDHIKICEIMAEMKVPEHFISMDAATLYVRTRFYSGKRILFSSKYKQKLYDSLYEEVMKLREYTCHAGKSIPEIVILALSKPAPCIGMKPSTIYQELPHKKHVKRRNKK